MNPIRIGLQIIYASLKIIITNVSEIIYPDGSKNIRLAYRGISVHYYPDIIKTMHTIIKRIVNCLNSNSDNEVSAKLDDAGRKQNSESLAKL